MVYLLGLQVKHLEQTMTLWGHGVRLVIEMGLGFGLELNLFYMELLPALPAAAMLMPGAGGIFALAKVAPLAAVVPAALGWSMDQVQSLATADMNHPLANLFRVGFDSYFIDNYDKNDPAIAGRSKAMPIWYRYVRPLDKWVAKKLFGVDFRVSEFNSFTPKEAAKPQTIVEKS